MRMLGDRRSPYACAARLLPRGLALLLSLLLPLAASPLPSAAAAKNPDTYTYLTISDFDSLDPAWSYDTFSHLVILNVYEPLFAFDGASTEKLIPLVAEKVPSRANGLISADGKTYTIPIRKNVKFTDGSAATPEDVRYSMLRFMLLDRDAGPSWMLLEPLTGLHTTRENGVLNEESYKLAAKSIEIQGNNIVLKLPKPYAPLLSILASWSPTLSKAWVAKNGGWDGTEATWKQFNNPKKESSPLHEKSMATGPWTLERWDRKTQEVVLARNDKYWRKPAKLARVVIKSMKEVSTRKLVLQAGDADAIYTGAQDWSLVQNIAGTRILDNLPTMEMNPVAYFTFDVNPVANPNIGSGRLDGDGVPPDLFKDPDMRKGFAYSFDYAGFIKDVYRGKATQATGCIPSSLPGHNAKQKTYTFDKKKAEEHFKKALGGKVWETGFKFTLTYNSGNNVRQTLAQILKRSVESINPKFQIDVRPVEWPTFLDAYKAKKLPIFILGWNADFPDAHSFAFPLMHSNGDYPSIQKYKNPKADELVEAAMGETDPAKRKALYAKLQAIEYEDAPHMVFIDSTRFRIQRDWVKGFYHNPVFPDSPYGSYFYPLSKE